jgi:hypothetical protein
MDPSQIRESIKRFVMQAERSRGTQSVYTRILKSFFDHNEVSLGRMKSPQK